MFRRRLGFVLAALFTQLDGSSLEWME